MKRFVYLWMLIGVSFFAVGCGQSVPEPPEGSAADEAAIEEDLQMQQEEMSGDMGAGDGANANAAAPE